MAIRKSKRADSDAELSQMAATAAAPGAVQAGSRAPLFVLPDAAGRPVALEQLLGRGAVVLYFNRGSWCNFAGQSLAAVCASHAQVAALGARAVVISPDGGAGQPWYEPSMPFLYDRDARVARSYGLMFQLPESLRARYRRAGYRPTAHGEWLVPLPAIYLLDRDGVVVLASLELDYRTIYRPEPLLQALRAMTAGKDRRLPRLC